MKAIIPPLTGSLVVIFSLMSETKATVPNEINAASSIVIASYGGASVDVIFANNNPDNVRENVFQLLDARPNPATAYTWIHYNLANTNQYAQLIIRNLVGTIVHSEVLESTTDRVKINTSDFTNGIYIYSLIIDNQLTSSKRLIIAN